MTPDLNRFITAQDADDGYDCYLRRIKDGDVSGRWVDYVFPQIFTKSMPDSEATPCPAIISALQSNTFSYSRTIWDDEIRI